MSRSHSPLPFVEPDIHDWTIYKLSRDSKEFGRSLIVYTMEMLLDQVKVEGDVSDIISKALYLERNRIKSQPWAADPSDEDAFWSGIKDGLIVVSKEECIPGKLYTQGEIRLLEDIVTRYFEEIAGHFNPSTFEFANAFIKRGLARLLNASPQSREKRAFWDRRDSVYERTQIFGQIQLIRELSKKGTLVVVPTHSSNLDSIVIGWLLRCIGLPGFLYGAGLNLFNFKPAAYFMSRLGAYKVDRRKKNRIYLETLKAYSTLTLKKGAHSLFFPGGTRSRSGKVETQLKYGLLSTTIEAQRLNLLDEFPRKIFVVTANLNYPFILEAPVLIDEHLKKEGKSKYIKKSEPSNVFARYMYFFLRFFRAKGKFCVHFGTPTDVFGNVVNIEGESLNKQGRVVNIAEYYMSAQSSKLSEDDQRDEQYTKDLSEHIVKEFLIYNLAMPVHVLAFVCYHAYLRKFEVDNIYDLIKQWTPKATISMQEVVEGVELLRTQILSDAEQGKIQYDARLKLPIDEFMKEALQESALYHLKKPIKRHNSGNLRSESIKTLLFYQNRISQYGYEALFEGK